MEHLRTASVVKQDPQLNFFLYIFIMIRCFICPHPDTNEFQISTQLLPTSISDTTLEKKEDLHLQCHITIQMQWKIQNGL